MDQQLQAQASVTVPSADLINYRFDEADKKFAAMGTKLDAILSQNANFITEDKVNKIVTEAVQPIRDTMANYRWYWRAMFVAVLAALGGVVTALIERH